MANLPAKIASSIVAGMLAGTALTMPRDVATAAECLPEPGKDGTQGQHWYYRIEHGTKRHCWYLRGQDGKAAQVAPADESEPAPKAAAQTSANPPRSVEDAHAEYPIPQSRENMVARAWSGPARKCSRCCPAASRSARLRRLGALAISRKRHCAGGSLLGCSCGGCPRTDGSCAGRDDIGPRCRCAAADHRRRDRFEFRRGCDDRRKYSGRYAAGPPRCCRARGSCETVRFPADAVCRDRRSTGACRADGKHRLSARTPQGAAPGHLGTPCRPLGERRERPQAAVGPTGNRRGAGVASDSRTESHAERPRTAAPPEDRRDPGAARQARTAKRSVKALHHGGAPKNPT